MAVRPEHVISLCSGGGGLELGLELAVPSARTVCMVEREAFAVARLVEAMRAGFMADCPVWSDVTTFRGRPWRGVVDWVIGGIPCQPHSTAGKRLGRDDERDLWADARRIIAQCRPRWVLIENVEGMLSTGGAQRVVNDLECLGFIVEGGLFSAAEVGFTHRRKRVFILGCAANMQRDGSRSNAKERARPVSKSGAGSGPYGMEHAARQRCAEGRAKPELWSGRNAAAVTGGALAGPLCRHGDRRTDQPERGSQGRNPDQWAGRDGLPISPPGPGDIEGWRAVLDIAPELEPAVRRMADGVASRVDQLRMLGNGVHPLAAANAVRTLKARIEARCARAAEPAVRAS
jgi:DNA (cytosine-5)-methyltransferase 1